MRLAEREETAQVPGWAVGFLRERCRMLQAQLINPCDPIFAVHGDTGFGLPGEEDSIHCWTILLVAAAGLPGDAVAALECLHLLHARIAQRLECGGVEDISPSVEDLVRTVLVDQLQRQTDAAVQGLA